MLTHKECGGTVTLDITKLITFLMSFGIGTRALTLGMGEIHFKKSNEVVVPDFMCTECMETIVVSDINAMCNQCGDVIDVSTRRLWKPNSSGGVYCEGCYETLFSDDSRTNLETIMGKVEI